MITLLIAWLLMTANVQAQNNITCADPNAEVSRCPDNYMPKVLVPSLGDKGHVIHAIEAAKIASEDEIFQLRELNRLKSNISGDPNRDGDYVRQLQVVQSATKAKYDLYNEAIRVAVAVYGLTPPIRDFNGDPRAAVGTNGKGWLPRYSERETYDAALGRFRPRTNEELAEERTRNGAVIGGLTWARGEISLFSQAFDNPDDLAVLIYHETSHWLDVVSKTGGFLKSDPPSVSFNSEVAAYTRSAVVAQKLGRDPTPMLALAAQFQKQADESAGRSWAWVIANKRNWLGTDRRGRLALLPPDEEDSSDGEETLQTKMTEMQRAVKENREYIESLEKERAEEAARRAESDRLERERKAREEEAAWDRVAAEAKQCGFKPIFQIGSGRFTGFGYANGGFNSVSLDYYHQTNIDMQDLRISLLLARACESIRYAGEQIAPDTPPTACNDSASALRDRISSPQYGAVLDFLFRPADGSREYCISRLLSQAHRFIDTAAFNTVVAAYAKEERERGQKERKRHRKSEEAREREERRTPHGGGSPPPSDDGNGRVWDPGCQCWTVRR